MASLLEEYEAALKVGPEKRFVQKGKVDPETLLDAYELATSQKPLPKVPAVEATIAPKNAASSFPGASFIEPAATIVTGAIAEPLAGLAGVAQGINPFAKAGASKEAVEGVRDALTFSPRTESGKEGLEAVADFLSPVTSALQKSEQFLGEAAFAATGSPAAAAIATSIPTALLEVLGAAGAKNALPKADAIINKVYTKTTGRQPQGPLLDATGAPTQEFKQVLETANLSEKDITDATLRAVEQGPRTVRVDDLVRKTRFEELNIPSTRGDVTQQFAQKKSEAQLLEAASDAGTPIREIRKQQATGLRNELDSLVDEIGAKMDVDSVKVALGNRERILNKQVGKFYKTAQSLSESLDEPVRLQPFKIQNASEARVFKNLRNIQSPLINAIKERLAEYGIIQDEKALKSLERNNIPVQGLDVGNFNELRSDLNALYDPKDPQNKALIRPIIKAIDDTIDDALSQFDNLDNFPESSADAVLATRRAINAARKVKTEFSQNSLVRQLYDTKRDGVTPLVNSSDVYKKLLKPNTKNSTIDSLTVVMDSLKKGGKRGRDAIKDLQAQVILDLTDAAFAGISRRIDGIPLFNSGAYNKALKNFGDKELGLLFDGKKALLKKLRSIGKAAQDITPSTFEVPKGSASVILDTLDKVGISKIIQTLVPGGRALSEALKSASKSSKNRADLKKALKNNPRTKDAVSFIDKELPNISKAIGFSATPAATGALTAIEESQQEQSE